MEGARCWLIPDGFLPPEGPPGVYQGHDCLCLLNTGGEAAEVWIDLFFEDRDPVEGIAVRLGARRCLHLRMDRPEALGGFELPRGVPYAVRVRASHPIVVQYSRLEVAQPNLALLSVMGYPLED